MGTKPRQKPERLAEKLRQIRDALGLSQSEMLKRLEADELIAYNEISKYELGLREPTLLILLRYARVAGVCPEVLIDDELDLPARLPGKTKHTHH
ncbi:MAG: helix-turn-helix transcriptional regulator [Pyrinomonadaceae bacterium]